jgi:hypothetical protein
MTDEIPLVTTPPMIERTLHEDITKILNRHNVENVSDTPDFILAQFLLRSLVAGEELVKARHAWLGLPNPWAQPGAEEPDAVAVAVEGIATMFPPDEKEIAHSLEALAAHIARVPMEDISDADLLRWMGTDAERWAHEFARKRAEVEHPDDMGWLIGWFANAIMSGYDEGWRAHAAKQESAGRPSPTTNADLD